MSNSEKVKELSIKLAMAIDTATDVIVSDHPELTPREVTAIKIKAVSMAALKASKVNSVTAVSLVQSDTHWIATAPLSFDGDVEAQNHTLSLLDRVSSEIRTGQKVECDCPSCKAKKSGSEGGDNQVNVNEQTAKAILKEIEEEQAR